MLGKDLLTLDENILDLSVGLVSHNAVIRFFTNSYQIYEFFCNDPFVRHHIPDIEVLRDLKVTELKHKTKGNIFPYTIIIVERPNAHSVLFDSEKRTLIVVGQPGQDFEDINLVFNAQQFFSRMHQEMGLFGIHCGAVCFDNGAALLLGGERAGKSTLVSKLCTYYGAEYLCDERALVSETNSMHVNWVGGNTVVTVRDDFAEYVAIEDLNHSVTNVTPASPTKRKTSFEFRTQKYPVVPIKHVIFPKLTRKAPRLYEANSNSTIYRIFADMSIDIHGTYGAFLKAGYALPSLDLEGLRTERLSTAIRIGTSAKLWNCEGDIDGICDMIDHIVKKEGIHDFLDHPKH